MKPDASGARPLSFDQVLADEYQLLHPRTPVSAADARVRHEQAGHTALCLSGGGIRSASFGLGVLQGLAEAGVLQSVDYLSTVSGGGYIGGWLSAWRLRASQRGQENTSSGLAASPEAEPVARLREVIKFLDPQVGWMARRHVDARRHDRAEPPRHLAAPRSGDRLRRHASARVPGCAGAPLAARAGAASHARFLVYA